MPAPRRLLGQLQVASLLIYPSSAKSDADVEARDVILTGIKQGNPRHLRRVAQRVSELPVGHPFLTVVPANAILVPVPRSTPLRGDSLWPSLEIANALHTAGVGALVLPLLVRDASVRRSTGARVIMEREPPLRHYETISAQPVPGLIQQDDSAHYVLVDDVVTTGSTLVACASHLRALVPAATITAFAVARAERDRNFVNASEMFLPTVQLIELSDDNSRPRRH